MEDLEAKNQDFIRALRERRVGPNEEGHSYLGIAF